MKVRLSLLDHIAFSTLFSAVVIFPTQIVSVKILLLLVCILVRLSDLHRNDVLNFDIYNFFIPIFYALVGIMYCVYGVLANNPGAVEVFPLHVIYPLLLGWYAGTCTEEELRPLAKMILVVLEISSIIIFMIFLLKIRGYHDIPLFDNARASLNPRSGYSKLSFPLLAVLNFSIPFLTMAFAYRKELGLGAMYYAIYCLTIIDGVVTGRRGTWVVLMLSLAAILFTRRLKISTFLLFVFLAAGAVVLAFWLAGLDVGVLAAHLGDGFKFASLADRGSSLARGEQFKAMIQGIVDSPIFGHGLGSTAQQYGSVRAYDAKWEYELTYVYYLFSTGIVGFLIYAAGIGWIVTSLWKFWQQGEMEEYVSMILAGLLGFLVAAGTNPYLQKFDYMFVIFVPYAFVVALKRKHRRLSEGGRLQQSRTNLEEDRLTAS